MAFYNFAFSGNVSLLLGVLYFVRGAVSAIQKLSFELVFIFWNGKFVRLPDAYLVFSLSFIILA